MKIIYDHALVLNYDSIPKSKPVYKCRYMFGNVGFDLFVYKRGVCIHQYTAKETTPWKFEPIGKSVNDALRKAYIIYALCNGKGLLIKKIRVFCDDQVVECFDKSNAAFPFVYSMLQDRQLAHEGEAKSSSGIFSNEDIRKYFTRSKRSDDQNDKKIIAFTAFLLGRSREYEADRFLNYWTSINAIYGYLCVMHEKKIMRLMKEIPDDVLEKNMISRDELTEFYIPFSSMNDNEQIIVFRSLIMNEMGVKKAKSKDRSKGKDVLLREINNDYDSPFEYFAQPYTDVEGKFRINFESLYERTISNLPPDQMTFSSNEEKEAYEKLTDWGIKVSGSVYAFLSVDEPYYMRNYYIHGSEAPLIVSNQYHLELLSCLNYFMDKLLTAYIPRLFSESGRKELTDKVHAIIYQKEKDKHKDIVKKVNDIARDLAGNKYRWIIGDKF